MTDIDPLLADVERLRKPRPWLHVTPDGTASFYIRIRPYTDGDLDMAGALRAALAARPQPDVRDRIIAGLVTVADRGGPSNWRWFLPDDQKAYFEAVAGSATPTGDDP